MSGASGDYSRFKNVYDGFVQSAANEAKSKNISNQAAIQNIAAKLTPEQLGVVRKVFEFIGMNKSQAPTLADHEIKILKDLEREYGAKGDQSHLTSPRKEGEAPLYKQVSAASRESILADDMPEEIKLQSHAQPASKESTRTQAGIENMRYFPKDVQQKLQSDGILKNAVDAMGKEKASELKKDIRVLQKEVRGLEDAGMPKEEALKLVSKDYATAFFGKNSSLSAEEKEHYLSKLIIGLQPRKPAQASGRLVITPEPPLKTGVGSRTEILFDAPAKFTDEVRSPHKTKEIPTARSKEMGTDPNATLTGFSRNSPEGKKILERLAKEREEADRTLARPQRKESKALNPDDFDLTIEDLPFDKPK